MKAAWIVLVAACSGPPSSPPPSNAGGARPQTPDLAAIRASLERHAPMHFDAPAIERGCPADQTLGEYVAMLVKNGTAEPGTKNTHRLSNTCGEFPKALAPVDPPADPAYWYCRIDSYVLDAESGDPWHYELRLRIRKADGAPDITTFGCPGSP